MQGSLPPGAGVASAAPASPETGFRRRNRRFRVWLPYLLVAPAVIYLLGITLYPGLYAIVQGFYTVRFGAGGLVREPAGFANYIGLAGDPRFWGALWNTALMGAISLALQCGIALTLAFHAYRDPWVRGWRIVFLVPMLFMPSAVAFIYKLMFLDARVFSDILMRLGLIDGHLAIQSSVWGSRALLILTDVWQWTAFLFIIFVAGLQAQDEEIEEAARLDGATPGEIFWNISLPLMRPVIVIALVIRGIDITTMFANVFIITKGGPAFGTETISYFIYRVGFKSFDFGQASAAAAALLVLTVILAQFVLKRAFRSAKD